ncbi:MAG TPA: carboxypeptidase regulatory-like domain-containing protein [Gemmatimonadaceae bacterium]|nr:carboxypeptidase regulatory-like domain-containing protein [Gemmatimonadaceae bacterium]
MRCSLVAITVLLTPDSTIAQNASLSGQVIHAEDGAPLGYTSVSVLSQPAQLLTSDAGTFHIVNLIPGEVRLRFRRIGFQPKDTTLHLAPDENAQVRIGLTRLVLRLPAVVVSGQCTNDAPHAAKPQVLAELFDQVTQNAERMRLLAEAKPFLIQLVRIRGHRDRSNRIIATYMDTIMRRPMPPERYQPKQVLRPGEGIDAGRWLIALPEAPDIADTAFTNNHCFSYAGQSRFEADSVIEVAFEPVPWLDKEVDIEGTLYLRVEDYQLVGSITRLNRIPAQFRRSGLQDYTVRARFAEIVDGVPVLDKWELTNRYRQPRSAFVEIGQVFNVRWTDSAAVTPDSTSSPRL